MRKKMFGWGSTFFFIALVVSLVVYAIVVVSHEFSHSPDTTFDCRPGETYTVKECP